VGLVGYCDIVVDPNLKIYFIIELGRINSMVDFLSTANGPKKRKLTPLQRNINVVEILRN